MPQAKPIIAPDLSPAPGAPEPVIADCCGCRGDYQYMRINRAWHQIGWIAISKEGNKATCKSFANPAVACQACGHIFSDDTPARKYHPGAFAPVDSIVDVLAANAEA